MATLVMDSYVEEALKAERRASGADRFDEVWEGVYMMAPMPNDEHQGIVSRLGAILEEVVGWPGHGKVRPGVNVSDREEEWEHNYRCPDVVVFLQGTRARNCDTHWVGGPDFLVEVISPQDKSREKLDFYARVGTREVLLVDRDPWQLELYRLEGETFSLVGKSTVQEATSGAVLQSKAVPLSLRLVPGDPRPQIEVTHHASEKTWLI